MCPGLPASKAIPEQSARLAQPVRKALQARVAQVGLLDLRAVLLDRPGLLGLRVSLVRLAHRDLSVIQVLASAMASYTIRLIL